MVCLREKVWRPLQTSHLWGYNYSSLLQNTYPFINIYNKTHSQYVIKMSTYYFVILFYKLLGWIKLRKPKGLKIPSNNISCIANWKTTINRIDDCHKGYTGNTAVTIQLSETAAYQNLMNYCFTCFLHHHSGVHSTRIIFRRICGFRRIIFMLLLFPFSYAQTVNLLNTCLSTSWDGVAISAACTR